MSEFLRNNPEANENRQDSDYAVEELVAEGLSQAISERKGDNGESDVDYYAEDDYGDDDGGYNEEENYGEDEDYYDDEDYYEEIHYGDERGEFNEERLTLHEIALPEEILKRYNFLNELPRGVAVMGGVARSIAREMITGEREPIRDIDLVNIIDEDGVSEVDQETLNALSQKFMPDDYAFNHGMGDDTLKNYFMTRDFTVNQSLIKDGKLIVSNFAYDDFQENIIRPTYFEHPYDGDRISSRLFLKALMMKSVLSQISDSVPLIEDMDQIILARLIRRYF